MKTYDKTEIAVSDSGLRVLKMIKNGEKVGPQFNRSIFHLLKQNLIRGNQGKNELTPAGEWAVKNGKPTKENDPEEVPERASERAMQEATEVRKKQNKRKGKKRVVKSMAEREKEILAKYPHAIGPLTHDANLGKYSVRIKCAKCGSTKRSVFSSDLFQVKICLECKAKAESKKSKKAKK